MLESVDLAATAESTVAEFRETEPGTMHDITVVVSGTPCPVNADSRAVKQMIQKLLSNAAKFSPRGTAIRVTIDAGSDACTRLQVADQGIGITAEMAELVVRPFRQADGRLARKYGGTGLGLSIVNALIERHGGRLTIDSAPSKGTCVSLDFVAAWEDATSRQDTTDRPGSAELAAE
jgi:signal transduction histidine kinase